MVRAFFTRSTLAAMTSLMVLASASETLAQDSDAERVIATVDGQAITSTQLGFIMQELGPRMGNAPEEQKKAQLTGALVDLQLVAAAAEKAGLGKSEAFRKQMDYLKLKALRNEFYRVNVDEKITEEDMKALYEAQIGAIPARQQVKARHILVKEEAEALELVKSLDGGADFAELAKEKSTGPSGPNGGDLGYFGQGQMVPAFEAAAFALDKDAYTKQPVKTQFGWHVILVEDKREEPKPTFEQVQGDIRGFIAQRKFAELLNGLKSSAKIEIVK